MNLFDYIYIGVALSVFLYIFMRALEPENDAADITVYLIISFIGGLFWILVIPGYFVYKACYKLKYYNLMNEIISIDQLAERYAEMNKEERREGFGATTPANHFALALLYLATDRFKLTKDHQIKIRKSSPFYRGQSPANSETTAPLKGSRKESPSALRRKPSHSN